MKCDMCGKTPQWGCNVSHSKRHTKRMWVGNIHPATVTIGGETKKLKLCTRCLRTRMKAAKSA